MKVIVSDPISDEGLKIFRNNYLLCLVGVTQREFKLLNFDFPTNRKYLHTYFEAGFGDDYYSSFAKKQNHWEVSKQPTYAYTVSARFYLKDKLTNATRVVI